MFIQVIKGQVNDRDAVERLGQRWATELRPGATGFLGATIGLADDGTLVNLARFESRDAAVANSTRPEQGAWFSEFEKCFDGEVSFRESEDVSVFEFGDLDAAGFVQVMEGRVLDRQAADRFSGQFEQVLRTERPDLLGAVQIYHPDGTYTDVAYFPSEAEARAGESRTPSPEAQETLAQVDQHFAVDQFIDLRQVWLF